VASAGYERQQELAREHGYSSIYYQTQGRAAAREFLESHGETYTPQIADTMNSFARDYEAGSMTRSEMRAWYDANVDDEGSDQDFYDWLRDWTDSGETE
jgi:hypothetical protein